jgi:hypothetical protein
MLRTFGALLLMVTALLLFIVTQTINTAPKTASAVIPPDSIVRLDQKITTAYRQAQAPAIRNQVQQVQLRLLEAEVAAKVIEWAKSRPDIDPKNLTLRVEDNVILFSGTILLAGLDVPFDAQIIAGAFDGYVVIAVKSIQLGTVPIGWFQDDFLERLFGPNWQFIDMGFDVRSVTLAQGMITVEGQTRLWAR